MHCNSQPWPYCLCRNKHEEDEEERKRKLRGAVMYISNPVTWVTKKWNIVKLRQKYDPRFSENEFLFGARQVSGGVFFISLPPQTPSSSL